jgi:hypothetical protein
MRRAQRSGGEVGCEQRGESGENQKIAVNAHELVAKLRG